MQEHESIQNEGNLMIRSIKETGFYIDELLIQDSSIPVKTDIGLQLSFTIETNLIYMLVRVSQHYPDAPNEQILADIQVQNIFEIEGLYNYQSGISQLILPQHIIISMVSLSISHIRALLAQRIAGSGLQGNTLPLVNPLEVAKHFFPEMFGNSF